MDELTGRQQVLSEALKLVMKDRNEDYGEPEDNFGRIAHLVQWWLSERYGWDGELDTLDAVMIMILGKAARLTCNTLHTDGWRDIVGYGAIGFELVEYERMARRATRTDTSD